MTSGLLVTYPDPERLTIDILTTALELYVPATIVQLGMPLDWRPELGPVVQVDLDGVPIMDHPIAMYATVRLVAHAATSDDAKELILLVQGLLLAHPGGQGVTRYRSLTGLFPASDPVTEAELASITVQATVRSIPLG